MNGEKQNYWNIKIKSIINEEKFPDENQPILYYVNIIKELTLNMYSENNEYENINIINEIPNIVYNYLLNNFKTQKNKKKLMNFFLHNRDKL